MEADYCIDFEAMGLDLERMRTSQSEITTARSRRIYAKMDVSSMGVDVDTGPVIADKENNQINVNDNVRNSLAYELSLGFNDSKNTSQEEINTGDSNDLIDSATSDDKTEESCEEDLPAGWERHEDSDGPYYWHVKSGTIQRDPPTSSESKEAVRQLVRDAESLALTGGMQTAVPAVVARSSTAFNLSEIASDKAKEEMAFKRRSYPTNLTQEAVYPSGYKPIRFAVRSLGWMEISEEELTPEKSSKAVNRCIVDLSLGKNELLDAVGRWGEGKDLFMDLDDASLKLVDPESLTILNSQPIHTIRVWGVGRDNGRDFAYVARDKSTRIHKCHVFRCDTPARIIANTLRDICKKIMIERSLSQNMNRSLDLAGCGLRGGAIRPTNLPTQQRKGFKSPQVIPVPSFPTPMEEPRKTMKALYVGSSPVCKPSGIDILNEAIDKLVISVDPDQWLAVNVSVAPSVVTVFDANDEENVIVESRVRFLSFLGIGRNVRHCGFIVHTAQDTFMAHVFVCEPSSAALCKTIEAACKLRFQKCLDAHGQSRARNSQALSATTPQRSLESLGAALKSVIGSIKKRGKSEANS
ncbi:protein Fe65 homolog isoform X2 [Artemia franciscana]